MGISLGPADPETGIASAGTFNRKPVFVLESSARYLLDGNGIMQCPGSRLSQPTECGTEITRGTLSPESVSFSPSTGSMEPSTSS